MTLAPQSLFASRYRLIKQIGLGGFSVVWLAADELADNLEFAVKIYAPERGLDEAGLKQFRKEYTVTANLQHLGLLKASYFDVHDGSPFLVMPFCKNGSLASLLQERGTLSEREIAEVLYQVADALAYLHEEGILHQDIKPDNVLINDKGKYLLTDFGISSRMHSTLKKSTSSTKALTVAYAPPERFIGSQTSDEKGDVFSIGVMLFELATGDVPWMGGGGAMLNSGGQAPELPTRFGKGLEQLMQRCLHFVPANRPTVAILKQAAQQYLQGGAWPTLQQNKERVTEPISNNPGGRSTEPLIKPKPTPQEDTPTRQLQPELNRPREQKAVNKTSLILIALAFIIITAGLFWWQPWTTTTKQIDPETEKRFLAIKSQAELLESENRWPEALSKYKESYALIRDSTVQQKIVDLEKQLKQDAKDKEDDAWTNAKQANTIAALQSYLIDYPEGQYQSEANRLIGVLEGQIANAKAKADDEEAWKKVKRLNTIAAYQEYIKNHPSGNFVSDAKNALKNTESQTLAEAEDERARIDKSLRDGIIAYNSKQYDKAIPLLRPAANLGIPEAQNYLGKCYSMGKSDYSEAMKWQQLAADQGYAAAQWALSSIFYMRKNYSDALKWNRLAADQGLVHAQQKMGDIYYAGEIVAKDYGEALRWYRLAADQGLADAQNMLGVMYSDGEGVAQNYREAVKWYRLAADQGQAAAQYNLGMKYLLGNGVTQNVDEAKRWLRKAADQGDNDAKEELLRLEN